MGPHANVEEILHLAEHLSAEDRRELIERLSSETTAARTAGGSALDDQYQRGYERIPEDTVEVEAFLPHLPLSAEKPAPITFP
jgi:hypothetical protein